MPKTTTAAAILISHRGSASPQEENTLEAFQACYSLGFRHFETDLRSTSDGVIVLSHDNNLKRTFGVDFEVSHHTFSELRVLADKTGRAVCSLEELYQNFQDCKWIYDIKPESGFATIATLQQWARQAGIAHWLVNQVRFLFWDETQRKDFIRIFPDARCLAGEAECYRAGVAMMLGMGFLSGAHQNQTYALPARFLSINLFRRRILKRYHEKGSRVMAYLPLTESDIVAAIAAGVDEILVDVCEHNKTALTKLLLSDQ